MLRYVDAGEPMRERIDREWGEIYARHMHTSDGFSIVALDGDEPVGLIAIVWRELPPPLPATSEAFVDIIEVRPTHRRRGIASELVGRALTRARQHGAYQLRAWSSDDKTEAIPLWRKLGFGLCPTTTYPGGQAVRGYFVTLVI
jgi:GNAT superfamily N-acetyltransferase